ncbi:MAG: YrdB family protein [Gemmatimonadetes bacterium]|nr:YrdB family protein [Gemmatimonadota bacterium]
MLKTLNLAIRFLLELCGLGLLAYWGVQVGANALLKVVLGVGVPLMAAVFWASFVSPKARFGGTRGVRLLLGLVVFLAAAAAWYGLGHTTAGIIFGLITILNTAVTYAFGPQPGETSPHG